MTEEALFTGPAIRRLRKREGLTQAATAARLDISPSYLNLIERNQRPVSARVMMQLVEQFDFDPRSLREDEAIGGIDGLARRFADERFADLGIEPTSLEAVLPDYLWRFRPDGQYDDIKRSASNLRGA